MDPFSVTFETALLTGGTKVMHRVCVVHFCATDKKPKRAVYNIYIIIYMYYIYILSHTNVIHLIYICYILILFFIFI